MGIIQAIIESGKIALWIVIVVFSGWLLFWFLSFTLWTKKDERSKKIEDLKFVFFLLPGMYTLVLAIGLPVFTVKAGFGTLISIGSAFLIILLGIFYIGLVAKFIAVYKRRKFNAAL
jgi:hypothetical protein